jgi:hypothetical protein
MTLLTHGVASSVLTLCLLILAALLWAIVGAHWLVFALGGLVGLIVGDVLAKVERWWQNGD